MFQPEISYCLIRIPSMVSTLMMDNTTIYLVDNHTFQWNDNGHTQCHQSTRTDIDCKLRSQPLDMPSKHLIYVTLVDSLPVWCSPYTSVSLYFIYIMYFKVRPHATKVIRYTLSSYAKDTSCISGNFSTVCILSTYHRVGICRDSHIIIHYKA